MFSSSCFALTKTAAAYFDPMIPLQQRVQTQLDLGVSDGLTVGAVVMAGRKCWHSKLPDILTSLPKSQ
jgi:hypothetical protein